MFSTAIKIAFRNFRKNRLYAVINLSGLAVGLAACWMLMLFVRHELNFDRFLKGSERIYQVQLDGNFAGQTFLTSNTPPPVGATLRQEFADFTDHTRIFQPGDVAIRSEEVGGISHSFTESKLLAVDSNFLEFFSFPVKSGAVRTCLDGLNRVVLTESMAQKYFGDAEPLGQILQLNNKPYEVTAILVDVPAQSSLQFDFLTSVANYEVVKYFDWSWVWLNVDTYVKTRAPLTDQRLKALHALFPAMVKKNAASAFRRIGQPIDVFLKNGGKWDFKLKPLEDVHLYSAGVQGRVTTLGSIREVYVYGTVGLLIILMACVNFMNISTARSGQRAREVGVRKALGSGSRALITQFLTESTVYGFGAGVLALALLYLCLPLFSQIIATPLQISTLFSGWPGALALLLPIGVGLLSGSYPALFLSRFNIVKVIKGSIPVLSGRQVWIRGGLVVFQFTISIALITCTIIVFQQLSYTRNKEIGLNQENVLLIRNAQRLEGKEEVFRQQISDQPEVINASWSTDVPTSGYFGDFYVPEAGLDGDRVSKDLVLSSYMVDYDFAPTMDIKIVQGRNFSQDFRSDSAAVILNETAVKSAGWKDPIGKYINYPGGDYQRFKVIGVMKDFNTQSFRLAIEPFALFHHSSKSYTLPYSYISVRVKPGQEKALISNLESRWKAIAPGAPLDYTFLDAAFAAQYRSEQKLGKVLSGFTGLAIFIACLGLLGLIAFAVEQRTKEIGIRKVLGASVAGIVGLLSRDLLRLVLMAVVIAVPLAWYAMNQWLQDFAYRVPMQWWFFALAGGMALLIAFLTIGWQSVRAALSNPVESLKSE